MRSQGNFELRRGADYGYRPLSGPAAGQIVWFRYYGTTNGIVSFGEIRPDKTTVFRCSGSCESATVAVLQAGRETGSQEIPVEGGTLVYAVVEDILFGRLAPYTPFAASSPHD